MSKFSILFDQGYNPGVEHTEVENATANYWYMWKLPMFGGTDVDTILLNHKDVMMLILDNQCPFNWI